MANSKYALNIALPNYYRAALNVIVRKKNRLEQTNTWISFILKGLDLLIEKEDITDAEIEKELGEGARNDKDVLLSASPRGSRQTSP